MPDAQSKRPIVLLMGHMYHEDGEKILAQGADVDLLEDPSPDEILEAISAASGAYVRYGFKATREVIEKGDNLLVISTSGRGTGAIDIEAATEKGPSA